MKKYFDFSTQLKKNMYICPIIKNAFLTAFYSLVSCISGGFLSSKGISE